MPTPAAVAGRMVADTLERGRKRRLAIAGERVEQRSLSEQIARTAAHNPVHCASARARFQAARASSRSARHSASHPCISEAIARSGVGSSPATLAMFSA